MAAVCSHHSCSVDELLEEDDVLEKSSLLLQGSAMGDERMLVLVRVSISTGDYCSGLLLFSLALPHKTLVYV